VFRPSAPPSAAAMQPTVEKNIVLSSPLPKIVLGFVMSAVNPVQIPFWFGWSAVLFSKNILRPGFWNYNAYLLGIGAGTFIAHCLFMLGGKWLGEQLNSGQQYLNWVIGFIFLATGIIQLIKIYTKKDAIHQLEHPEEVTGGLEKNIH
jgi:threonine/homoserine/homoserine lactone efflux protein